jgi:hypothetical protein
MGSDTDMIEIEAPVMMLGLQVYIFPFPSLTSEYHSDRFFIQPCLPLIYMHSFLQSIAGVQYVMRKLTISALCKPRGA